MNRQTRRLYGAACGSWGCGTCAPIKRAQVIRRVRLGLETEDARTAARRPRLLTLTTDPRESMPVAASLLGARFERLRRRAERATGERIEFLAVAERGRRGRRRLHLHVIYRGGYLHQREWSRMAEAVGLGYIVDVRQVRADELAAYASKSLAGYLTKAADEVWPRHFRRVRASRGWAPTWVVYRPVGTGEWVRLGIEPGFDPVGWVRGLAADRESAGSAPPGRSP